MKSRGIDAKALEAFDIQLCELMGCRDTAAGRIVVAYADLSHLLDLLKGEAN
ncbi:MAG: chitinase N-terminal domain-containing protein [Methanothrix sp.]